MPELRSLALANVSAPFHRLVAHATPWRAERSAESQQLLGRLRELGMRRDGSGRYMPVSNGAPITADAVDRTIRLKRSYPVKAEFGNGRM